MKNPSLSNFNFRFWVCFKSEFKIKWDIWIWNFFDYPMARYPLIPGPSLFTDNDKRRVGDCSAVFITDLGVELLVLAEQVHTEVGQTDEVLQLAARRYYHLSHHILCTVVHNSGGICVLVPDPPKLGTAVHRPGYLCTIPLLTISCIHSIRSSLTRELHTRTYRAMSGRFGL